PATPLFPYTTLFRSRVALNDIHLAAENRKLLVLLHLKRIGGDLDRLIAVLPAAETDLGRGARRQHGNCQHRQQAEAYGISHLDRSEEHTSELQSREK